MLLANRVCRMDLGRCLFEVRLSLTIAGCVCRLLVVSLTVLGLNALFYMNELCPGRLQLPRSLVAATAFALLFVLITYKNACTSIGLYTVCGKVETNSISSKTLPIQMHRSDF